MNRVAIGAAAMLLSLLLAVSWLYKRSAAELAVAEREKTVLVKSLQDVAERMKRDQAELARRERSLIKLRRQHTQAQQALSEALQRNKSWSTTDVPPDIQNALSGPPDGLPDRLRNAADRAREALTGTSP